jgi:hypothetical protein
MFGCDAYMNAYQLIFCLFVLLLTYLMKLYSCHHDSERGQVKSPIHFKPWEKPITLVHFYFSCI